eukprot:11543913-Alexandrium_andersonii.AAC.1
MKLVDGHPSERPCADGQVVYRVAVVCQCLRAPPPKGCDQRKGERGGLQEHADVWNFRAWFQAVAWD